MLLLALHMKEESNRMQNHLWYSLACTFLTSKILQALLRLRALLCRSKDAEQAEPWYPWLRSGPTPWVTSIFHIIYVYTVYIIHNYPYIYHRAPKHIKESRRRSTFSKAPSKEQTKPGMIRCIGPWWLQSPQKCFDPMHSFNHWQLQTHVENHIERT